MDRVLTIARHFLVDALRASVTRIYLLLLAMAVIAGGFVAQLAVIEQDVFRLSLVSAVIRLLAVAVVTVQGCASFSDQARHGQLELTLSLNMSRGHYLVGRALGGGFYALLLALLATLALAQWAPQPQLLFWGVGLACELLVMALFALFVSVTFSSLAAGVLLAMAFYLLSRFIEAFVLMTTVAGAGSFGAVLVWISWLVPNFGRYNQSSWLVYSDSGWSQILPLLGPVLTETGVIGALLLVAAMVGFYRREI